MTAFTADQLVAAGLADRATALRVYEDLNFACARFDIREPRHVAVFLAECSHESCGFKVTSENLNYSAEGLLRVFPKHFRGGLDGKLAIEYARQPERIANKVYANRMGNGSEVTGDGWRFRGRGFIQLTGRNNYAAFGRAIGEDVVSNPDLVATPKYAALSAAWYWESRNLNRLADTPEVDDEARAINGGTVGLEDRKRLTEQALKVFVG